MSVKRTPADVKFSKLIRERDEFTCQRCGSQPDPRGLHTAHGFTRRTGATRHDPINAMLLCYGCHQFVDSHAAEKEALWRLKFGDEAFDALTLRAHTATKVPKEVAR